MRPGWGALVGAIALLLATPAAGQVDVTQEEAVVVAEAQALYTEYEQAMQVADYGLALALGEEMVDLTRAGLGDDHPETLAAINDLASVLALTGSVEQAEELSREALDGRRRVLGNDHPHTLTSMRDHAAILQRLEQFEEAVALNREVLDLSLALHGDEHEETAFSMLGLGIALRDRGEIPEAKPLLRRAMDLNEVLLGQGSLGFLQAVVAYSSILSATGEYDEGKQLLRGLLPVMQLALGERSDLHMTALDSYAQFLWRLGEFQDAEVVQQRVLRLRQAVLGPQDHLSLQSLGNYAMVLRALGRPQEAEPLLRQAVAGYERIFGEDSVYTASARHNLALALSDLRQDGEAVPIFQDTLALRERDLGRAHSETLLARNNLATAYMNLGLYDEAAPILATAVTLSMQSLGMEHPDTARYLGNYAMALEQLGQTEEAEQMHLAGLGMRRQLLGNQHPNTLLASSNFAVFHLFRSGRPADAYQPALMAVQGWRQRRDMLGDDPRSAAQRERDQIANDYAFETLLDAAWEAQQAGDGEDPRYREEALATIQDMLAGTTSSAIALSAARRAAEDNQQGAARYVRDRQSLNDQWLVLERQLTEALGDSTPESAVRRADFRAELASLEESIEAIDLLLRDWAPNYFALIRPDSLDVAEAQALLRDDEAIMMLVPTVMGTHLVSITSDEYRWVRTEATRQQVAYAVQRLQYDLRITHAAPHPHVGRWAEENATNGGDMAYNFDLARAMYRQWFAPLEDQLEGRDHVFVMSTGELSGLPLGLLVSDIPEGTAGDPETLRSAPWLADRFAFITVPSLQAIRYLRQSQRAEAAGSVPFLGFGNPVLDGPPSDRSGRNAVGTASAVFSTALRRGTRSLADLDTLRAMSSLPGTERELRAMWRTFGEPDDALYLADAASESVVKAMDLNADVIAFATHGLLASEAGSLAEPGLVLTPPSEASLENDGYLSMSEVAQLQVDADWVILSACNTAGGSGDDASGLSGLARAFFFAGARNLLVSHWPVRDDVAAELTARTVELARARADLSRAQAFQQAMAEIRNDPQHDDWAHPSAWAPFALVGDR